MSAQVNFPLTNEAACLDPLQTALRFRNVWYENDAGMADCAGDGLDLRWLCLAVEPENLDTVLAILRQAPVPVDTEVYRHAAIAHLHSDGRTEWTRVAQIEFVLRAEQIVALLDQLQAAGILSAAWDHVTIIRNLRSVAEGDCQILPADAGAPWSHFVRWRRSPLPA